MSSRRRKKNSKNAAFFNWSLSENFLKRVAELNPWSPDFFTPMLAWSSTITETTFAVMLITGLGVRWAAFGSAVLLFWLATAMLVFTGLKPPLDYSVYSASACALLLAFYDNRATIPPETGTEKEV